VIAPGWHHAARGVTPFIMTWIDNAYNTLRTAFGTRQVRHSGHLYTCPPQPAESEYVGAGYGLLDGAAGVLRLLVSELKKPYPEVKDDLSIKDPVSGEWEDFTVLSVAPHQNGATLRIEYAEQYAG